MSTSGPQETQNEGSRRRESLFTPPPDTNSMRSQSPASTILSSSLPTQRTINPGVRNLRDFSNLPLRRPLIKADLTITTNFDPADAELYALWGSAK
ncbi:hypothetical protein Clacol_001809 [Clathrus columnatus]|uniref:Uncharacterized protein n=1 Tax=Clathrus columnatus TaxID=1419009 RepID=A0AAV4ZZ35_9AGAM|nr:hypothetical protein Clacol_001809 [Clathrus columnatus]